MTIRTNLRTWRQDAIYCIVIYEKGNSIRAELEAITVCPMSRITLDNMLVRMQEIQKGTYAYMVEHDPSKNITTPQDAIKEAIRRYKSRKGQEFMADEIDELDLAS